MVNFDKAQINILLCTILCYLQLHAGESFCQNEEQQTSSEGREEALYIRLCTNCAHITNCVKTGGNKGKW